VSKHENIRLEKKFLYPELYLDHDVPGLGTMAVAFGTDAPRLNGNHRKYLYGPGSILLAHGQDEQIGKSELLESVQVYKKIVKHCLGS
jgi:acetylornithine deacetylase/succinyl-diaminopimelate desuccinylase-like protein